MRSWITAAKGASPLGWLADSRQVILNISIATSSDSAIGISVSQSSTEIGCISSTSRRPGTKAAVM